MLKCIPDDWAVDGDSQRNSYSIFLSNQLESITCIIDRMADFGSFSNLKKGDTLVWETEKNTNTP